MVPYEFESNLCLSCTSKSMKHINVLPPLVSGEKVVHLVQDILPALKYSGRRRTLVDSCRCLNHSGAHVVVVHGEMLCPDVESGTFASAPTATMTLCTYSTMASLAT
jgi:hypothetical protein